MRYSAFLEQSVKKKEGGATRAGIHERIFVRPKKYWQDFSLAECFNPLAGKNPARKRHPFHKEGLPQLRGSD